MAVVKACLTGSGAIKNPGSECDTSLGPIKMLLMGDLSIKYTAQQLAAFVTTILAAIQATGKNRVYPLFGNRFPIWETTQNNESDVTETSPDTGQVAFIRSGAQSLSFSTTKGGLCLAAGFNSIGRSNLGFIPVDEFGTFIIKKNSDGTFGFFSATTSPQAPVFAVGGTQYKNRFSLSFNPGVFVSAGEIYTGAAQLLDEEGLIDLDVISAAAATTTSVTVQAVTECAGTNLFDVFGGATTGVGLRNPSSWVINKADGTNVPVTGVTVSGKSYVLAFTAVASATVLTVNLADTATLHTNLVDGFEGITPATITIP